MRMRRVIGKVHRFTRKSCAFYKKTAQIFSVIIVVSIPISAVVSIGFLKLLLILAAVAAIHIGVSQILLKYLLEVYYEQKC